MKVGYYDMASGKWADLGGAEYDMLRIDDVNAELSINKRGGHLNVTMRPSGVDFYTTLEVQDISANSHEVRFSARGLRVSESPALTLDTISVGLANLALQRQECERDQAGHGRTGGVAGAHGQEPGSLVAAHGYYGRQAPFKFDRDTKEFLLRCNDCAERGDAAYWPLTTEFWNPSQLQRCRACGLAKKRRQSRQRTLDDPVHAQARREYNRAYYHENKDVISMKHTIYMRGHRKVRRARKEAAAA
jgi:hypothetical protein